MTVPSDPEVAAADLAADAYSSLRDLQTLGTWTDARATAIVRDVVDFGDRLVEAALAILKLHPRRYPAFQGPEIQCAACRVTWPCATVKALGGMPC